MDGYPDVVRSPGCHSRAMSNVFGSSHVLLCLPCGMTKPSFTKLLDFRSNSRLVTASSPPSDRLRMQRVSAGSAQSAPFQNQFAFSAFDSASRSRTVCHAGDDVW